MISRYYFGLPLLMKGGHYKSALSLSALCPTGFLAQGLQQMFRGVIDRNMIELALIDINQANIRLISWNDS